MCGLLCVASLAKSEAASIPIEIEVTAYAQPLHTVCPIYRDVFDRTLIISPQVTGREIQLGPMKASKEEWRVVLPAVLAAAGYEIRKVSESVDMLEQVRPTPVQPEEPAPTRILLRYASAADIAKGVALLFPVQPPAPPPNGQETQRNTIPQAPPPTLIAAPDNSLHFNGTRSQLEVVRSYVETMDVQARLVHIRAIIGHVSLGDVYESGADWLTALDDFTSGNAGPGSITVPTRAKAASLTFYGQVGSLSRYLKLSEEDRHFRTDSRPSLFVRSGSSAEITSGERVAYPQSVLTTANGQASTSATVAYQDVLLRLKVEALVNSQDQITLKLTQTNDTVTGSSSISGNNVPTIGSQTLTTEVMLESGATVALGGVVTTRTSNRARGVSKLRKIPLLGRLFEVRTGSTTDEELIVLIEATVQP